MEREEEGWEIKEERKDCIVSETIVILRRRRCTDEQTAEPLGQSTLIDVKGNQIVFRVEVKDK